MGNKNSNINSLVGDVDISIMPSYIFTNGECEFKYHRLENLFEPDYEKRSHKLYKCLCPICKSLRLQSFYIQTIKSLNFFSDISQSSSISCNESPNDLTFNSYEPSAISKDSTDKNAKNLKYLNDRYCYLILHSYCPFDHDKVNLIRNEGNSEINSKSPCSAQILMEIFDEANYCILEKTRINEFFISDCPNNIQSDKINGKDESCRIFVFYLWIGKFSTAGMKAVALSQATKVVNNYKKFREKIKPDGSLSEFIRKNYKELFNCQVCSFIRCNDFFLKNDISKSYGENSPKLSFNLERACYSREFFKHSELKVLNSNNLIYRCLYIPKNFPSVSSFCSKDNNKTNHVNLSEDFLNVASTNLPILATKCNGIVDKTDFSGSRVLDDKCQSMTLLNTNNGTHRLDIKSEKQSEDNHIKSPNSDTSRQNQKSRYQQFVALRDICSSIYNDALFISGIAVASNKEILKATGITHIVNLAADQFENVFPDDFIYKKYFIKDSRNEDLESILYDALDFIEFAMSNNHGKNKILIHCKEGVSRSATFAVAYIMWKEKFHFDDAVDFVVRKRPICNPNIGFTCQLLQLAKRFGLFPNSASTMSKDLSNISTMDDFKHAKKKSTRMVHNEILSQRSPKDLNKQKSTRVLHLEKYHSPLRIFRVSQHNEKDPLFLVLKNILFTNKSVDPVLFDNRFAYLIRQDLESIYFIGPECPFRNISDEAIQKYKHYVRKFEAHCGGFNCNMIPSINDLSNHIESFSINRRTYILGSSFSELDDEFESINLAYTKSSHNQPQKQYICNNKQPIGRNRDYAKTEVSDNGQVPLVELFEYPDLGESINMFDSEDLMSHKVFLLIEWCKSYSTLKAWLWIGAYSNHNLEICLNTIRSYIKKNYPVKNENYPISIEHDGNETDSFWTHFING